MKNLLPFLLILSCSHIDEEKHPRADFEPKPLYDHYVERLPEFTEDGWIVSRETNGDTEHEGDSLIWTGIAMAALPCDAGKVFEDRMIKMIEDNGGALVRYEPLGEYEGGREISFDGATGLYFGIQHRIMECGQADAWRDTWKLHTDFVDRNYGYLHPNARAAVNPEFTTLPDYISHLLGQRGEPDSSRVRVLETQVAGWAYAVRVGKRPCFRMHLGWIYMRAMEKLGALSDNGKKAYCSATKGGDIPLIDHWCGRRHISHWTFKQNEWEYRHQRCGEWETPDGKGHRTPGLDLLIAYSEVLSD